MNPPQSNPDLYLHIKVVVSIIVGLCITTLLNGFARFVHCIPLAWKQAIIGVEVPDRDEPLRSQKANNK
jgi:hypothetical protein